MYILEKYNPNKTYMFLTGQVATPEVIAEAYLATQYFTCVITTDESRETWMGFDSLSALRAIKGIDPELNDDEAIQAIQDMLNAPQVVNTEPTAEARIAAALEAQVMLSLPAVHADDPDLED